MYFGQVFRYFLKRLLILFIKVAEEWFIKHFGNVENIFVEDTFSYLIDLPVIYFCSRL